jgi:hypothetical protein
MTNPPEKVNCAHCTKIKPILLDNLTVVSHLSEAYHYRRDELHQQVSEETRLLCKIHKYKKWQSKPYTPAMTQGKTLKESKEHDPQRGTRIR